MIKECILLTFGMISFFVEINIVLLYFSEIIDNELIDYMFGINSNVWKDGIFDTVC